MNPIEDSSDDSLEMDGVISLPGLGEEPVESGGGSEPLDHDSSLGEVSESDSGIAADGSIDDSLEALDGESDDGEWVDEDDDSAFSDEEELKRLMQIQRGEQVEVPVDDEDDPLRGFSLDAILGDAIDAGASDVHITPNMIAAYSVSGDIVKVPKFGVIDGELTLKLMQEIVTSVLEHDFVEDLELDTSYTLKEGPHRDRRTRLNVGKTFGNVYMVFRIISDNIPAPEDLGITGTLLDWTKLPNGLLMMNGPTGTGKALRLDTVIPSVEGPLLLRDVEVGTKLFDSKKKECTVTGLSPVEENPVLFKIVLSDGQVIFADVNHQWVVADRMARRNARVRNFEPMSERRKAIMIAAKRLEHISQSHLAVGNMSVREICKLLKSFDLLRFFGGVRQVEQTLRFMSVKRKSLVDGVTWPLQEALESLGYRLRQRVPYRRGSQLMVLTTGELLASGIEKGNYAIPVAGCYESDEHMEWLYIRSIDSVSESDEEYGPVRCISVDSEDSTYLCADDVVTHNSTTLASMLRKMQLERQQKIITVEKPIEYVYPEDGKGLVVQREVGPDTRSFYQAMDSAMRQNPDVILIGEVRNREEVDQLLRAAESGHLAISTMHTNSAAATINRIKSLFDGNEQYRILSSLSDSARGFANQVLLRKKDGSGRFAIREILAFNDDVTELVLNGDVPGLRKYQYENHITMEHGLVKAVIDNRCTFDEARYNSPNPELFDQVFKELS